MRTDAPSAPSADDLLAEVESLPHAVRRRHLAGLRRFAGSAGLRCAGRTRIRTSRTPPAPPDRRGVIP